VRPESWRPSCHYRPTAGLCAVRGERPSDISFDRASIKPNGDAVYQQIYEQVRAKDDISFKLLSLVPLISGAGISILIKTDIAWGLKCFVSLFGATVTFSIFRWELRNIGWCDLLLKQARQIDHAESPEVPKLRISPGKRVAVGKTEAETILYLTVILAWLMLPGLDALLRPREQPGVAGAVAALAVGLALATWAVATSKVTWKRMFEVEAVTPSESRKEQRPEGSPVDGMPK